MSTPTRATSDVSRGDKWPAPVECRGSDWVASGFPLATVHLRLSRNRLRGPVFLAGGAARISVNFTRTVGLAVGTFFFTVHRAEPAGARKDDGWVQFRACSAENFTIGTRVATRRHFCEPPRFHNTCPPG